MRTRPLSSKPGVATKPSVRSSRDLQVWNDGVELAALAYDLTKKFPRDELYGLTSQIRRSAGSVPANTAEGYGRSSTGSYLQHLKVARGSLNELVTHLEISVRAGIVRDHDIDPLLRSSDKIGRVLSATIRTIESLDKPARRPRTNADDQRPTTNDQ